LFTASKIPPSFPSPAKIIRKLEASRIQESPDAKVVLFKTALSTGWDCPRAEVMMSFRRAEDPTASPSLSSNGAHTVGTADWHE